MGDLPSWTHWLVELRQRRGWSQTDLAEALRRLAETLPKDLGVGRVAGTSIDSIERTIRRDRHG